MLLAVVLDLKLPIRVGCVELRHLRDVCPCWSSNTGIIVIQHSSSD